MPQPAVRPGVVKVDAGKAAHAVDSGCAGLVRSALAGGSAPPGLALRRAEGSAAVANDLGLAEAPGAAGCVLMVDVPRREPAVQRKVLSRQWVRSSYTDGTERVANPEHVELRSALSRAERSRGADARIFTTGVPTLDLIGSVAELVVAGVDKAVRLHEAASLREELERTPAEIERQRTRRYSYTSALVEARRGVAVRVALLDAATGTAREAEATTHDTAVFQLAEGKRPTDLGTSGPAAVDLAAVAAWEQALPPLRVSDLLAQLLQDGAERPETAHGLLARWTAPLEVEPAAGAASPPALASLVQVAGSVADGVGFFVGDGQVLTLDRLVRGSDLVRITGADGRTSFAMVERRDRRRGLALLRVQLPTAALALADQPPGRAAAVLAWPGGPTSGAPGRLARDEGEGQLVWQAEQRIEPPGGAAALDGGRVTAIVAETGDLGAVLLPASELRAFLAAGS